MGYKFWTGVDSVGNGGGLWVAWDEKYKISLVQKCSNFIVLKVVDERNLEWVLALVYGHPKLCERRRVWGGAWGLFDASEVADSGGG